MCSSNLEKSLVFTTEPELTRALAAEIRNDPDRFLQLLEKLLGRPLGGITKVACEEKERLDLVLTCFDGSEITRIGIEAKCDHVVARGQLKREKEVVDYLLLLVLDERDAEPDKGSVDGVMTWEKAIECFDQPRLTSWDLEHLPAQKRAVERLFNEVLPSLRCILPESDWSMVINRNGSGMPHIDIASREPVIIKGKGREIRGNIQVSGRDIRQSLEDVRFQCFIGIEIEQNSLEDFPNDCSSAPEPAWIIALKQLDADVLFKDGIERYPEFAFHKTSGQCRKAIPHMRELVDRYLGKQRYLIKGYKDWAFGAQSQPFPISNLKDNAKKTANIFKNWRNSIDKANYNQ